ncbi:PAS domain S-box protein [Actinoplanes regularis]|uniref:histidine kinase n=1 Tax=Actinoplanes regularis TaxID=52697 RepID=A0A238YZ03_9ACTN|nr:PAS domain S-box protein [Actinoplanes regularis]SNR76300.1 PAS domain S-box-containing protein [Actinoplanes regularis]
MKLSGVETSAAVGAVANPVRLAAVAATGLPGHNDSPVLDRISGLAARLLGAPVTLVSLVEAERQCLVSHVGLEEPRLTTRETPMSHSYCRYVVESGEPLVVADAREHPLLRDNPAIVEYDAIAYLGVPLRSPAGLVLGTLCAVDTTVRQWTDADVAVLQDLAAAAAAEIAARISEHDAVAAATRTQMIIDSALDAFVAVDGTGVVTGWNVAAERMFGWSEPEALGRPISELIIPERFRHAHAAGLARVAGGGESTLAGQRVAVQAVHRGGREFPIELALSVLPQPTGGPVFHAFIRDMTSVRRSEMLRQLEYDVADALAGTRSAAQAAGAVVARVGERLAWPYVEYWHLDNAGTRLVRLASWSQETDRTAPMRAVDAFARGEGLVGQVWAQGTARWISDLPGSALPRAAAAGAAGLRSEVAVPVRNGTDVVGVLTAFDRHSGEADDELTAALDTIAAHIGQYVHRRRAEELELELARARRDFDRVVAGVRDYLWTVRITPDGEMSLVYASPNGSDIFGGPPPADGNLALVGADMVHPDDRHLFDAFHVRLCAQQPAEVECRLVGADGLVRWVWSRATPRHDDGELFVDGVCTDVTERHHAQTRLRQQAELLDLAPVAVIVRDLDSRVTYWNRGAETTYGWDSDAAHGRITHRLLGTRFPDGRVAVDAALVDAGQWEGELDHLRSDGTRITVLSRQAMQYDDEGRPAAILEVNVDVTGRKLAERRLADSEQRLRSQFALATIGQATLTLDGTFLEVNPALARMLGRPVAAVQGHRLDELTHPDDRAESRRIAARLFAEEGADDRHQRLLHVDGGIVDAQIGMSLVRDADGRPVNFVAVVQDITARLAAERDRDAAAAELVDRNAELQDSNAQLAAANVLKLDLMGMLSHEIGTPLTAIAGYAEVLTDTRDSLDRMQRKAVDAIARGARRLDLLRGEILTMCTLDAGRLQATPEPVALAPALAEVLGGLDLAVPVECPALLKVLVHPSHLQQIVTNFCTNAGKYAGGVTAVTVEQHDDTVVIGVHDEGPGVPEHLRPELFDRYTRAAGTAKVKGHGLGLYIVKALAEANNGTVGHRPGRPAGSVFTLTLPKTTSLQDPEVPENTRRPQFPGTRSPSPPGGAPVEINTFPWYVGWRRGG